MENNKKHEKCLEVVLCFAKDNTTGEYGLTHDKAINNNVPYCPVWEGTSIFHYVFGYWWEGNHDYFKGENAFNGAGEIAAYGATLYFYEILEIKNMCFDIGFTALPGHMAFEISDSINTFLQGKSQFYTYRSEVPDQRPHYYQPLETLCNEVWERVERPAKNKGISERKIKNLLRWGANISEHIAPKNLYNHSVLTSFIDYWDGVCEQWEGEALGQHFKSITFAAYRSKKGALSWSATLNPVRKKGNEVRISSDKPETPLIPS